MRKMKILYLVLPLILITCNKNKDKNVYDDWTNSSKDPMVNNKDIDPNTIEGLHKNIFKPTCSNSGCHDGNFEPDFRSIESSYNSLVNRYAINTDPNNAQLVKRVVPNEAINSMLLHRLKTFIPGSQGQMPLSVDPGNDWNLKKQEYIQNIENWINNGAKDQLGRSPDDIDFTPQMGGLIVFANGSNQALPHDGYNPVNLPSGTNAIKIMLAFLDDKTPVNQLNPTSINFTLNPYLYDSTSQVMTIESSPYNAKGVGTDVIPYWHSITLNVSDLGVPGDVIWVKVLTTDKVNPPIEIPSNSTPFNFKKYFAIRIN
jgi:hypothetical protein